MSETGLPLSQSDKIAVAKAPFPQRRLLFGDHDSAWRALGDRREGVDPYEAYETRRTLCVSLVSRLETRSETGAESEDSSHKQAYRR